MKQRVCSLLMFSITTSCLQGQRSVKVSSAQLTAAKIVTMKVGIFIFYTGFCETCLDCLVAFAAFYLVILMYAEF